jgi:hypothetical protein
MGNGRDVKKNEDDVGKNRRGQIRVKEASLVCRSRETPGPLYQGGRCER